MARAIQWAPSGNALEGKPGDIVEFLADEDGTTHGYGYGEGWTMVFGSEFGDVYVKPGQWIIRDENYITVADRFSGNDRTRYIVQIIGGYDSVTYEVSFDDEDEALADYERRVEANNTKERRENWVFQVIRREDTVLVRSDR